MSQTPSDPLEQRRKLEHDLMRLGVSPDEIRRLLDADSTGIDPPVTQAALPSGSTPDDIVRMARAKEAARLAGILEKAEKSVLNVPEFRDATPEETRKAELLLREAALLRRRQQYKQADAKCREALQLCPRESSALELLGDLYQDNAQVELALAAYKRAVQADPKRSAAEKKYADLIAMQQRWDMLEQEEPDRNPRYALFLSLLLPGAGQCYNTEYAKGVVLFVLDALLFWMLAYSPMGFTKQAGTHTSLYVSLGITTAIYLWATWDAVNGTKPRHGKSGWDV